MKNHVIIIVMKKNYHAVILSPHLDDAVFSCAGSIKKLRQQGPVLVINIFTQYLSHTAKSAVPLSDVRYQEEHDAATLLDYEFKNLGQLDAFFRRPKFQSIANIFRPLDKEDLNFLPHLKKIIFDVLDQIECDRIYVPLAVGWHVDHCLTFLAMLDYDKKDKIYFYEDAPYCLIGNATDLRLQQLSGRQESFIQFLRRAWQASIAFYHSGMVQTIRPSWQRIFAFPVVSIYLFNMLTRHLRTTKQVVPMDPTPILSDASECFDIKIQAVSMYKSQIYSFFRDETDIRSSYQHYVTRLGFQNQYVERFWKCRQ